DDWTALQLLTQIGAAPAIAPTFLGGDRAVGVMVMEDLGADEGPSLEALLQADDADAAEAGLRAYVAALRRLHALTCGRAAEYRRLRDALGPRVSLRPLYKEPWSSARGSVSSPAEIETAVQEYRSTFAAIGIAPRPGVDAEIAEVTHAVEE